LFSAQTPARVVLLRPAVGARVVLFRPARPWSAAGERALSLEREVLGVEARGNVVVLRDFVAAGTARARSCASVAGTSLFLSPSSERRRIRSRSG